MTILQHARIPLAKLYKQHRFILLFEQQSTFWKLVIVSKEDLITLPHCILHKRTCEVSKFEKFLHPRQLPCGMLTDQNLKQQILMIFSSSITWPEPQTIDIDDIQYFYHHVTVTDQEDRCSVNWEYIYELVNGNFWCILVIFGCTWNYEILAYASIEMVLCWQLLFGEWASFSFSLSIFSLT